MTGGENKPKNEDKGLAFGGTLMFLFVLHARWDVTTGEFYFSSSLWLSFDIGGFLVQA